MEILIKVKEKKVLAPLLSFLKSIGIEAIEQVKKKKISKQKTDVSALRKIAQNGGIKDIKDPVTWQKEQRKDRGLPR